MKKTPNDVKDSRDIEESYAHSTLTEQDDRVVSDWFRNEMKDVMEEFGIINSS